MNAPSSRGRRDVAIRGALVLMLALSAFLFALPERSSAAGTVLFGANPALINGSRSQGVDELENYLGREMDLVRDFEQWDSQFPAPFHDDMIESDRLLIISLRAKRKNGTKIQWADIANSQPGDQLYDEMVGWVEGVRDLGVPVWFGFHHEPESAASAGHGTDADFKAAFQRFVDEFRARGVTNVEFAWIMTSWSFETDPSDARYADKWYPGDAYVDHIGADTYNWDHCRDSTTDSWRPLESTAEGQRLFGLDHPDKGLFFGEIASTELPGDGGAAKANWISEVQELLKQPGWEQFEAVSWFNVIEPSHTGCLWPVDSSQPALDAWIEMGNDPFYGGAGGGGGTTTTTTQPGTTSPTTTSPTTTTPGGTTPTTTVPAHDGTFVDVAPWHPFAADVEWLAARGITSGCNPPDFDLFCPNDPVTRGQMAAFLVRALGYSAGAGLDLFVDDDNSVFEQDIDRLAYAEVTNGCTSISYCPTDYVMRAQMAAFLVRALGYTDDGGGDLFTDDDNSVFEGDIDRLATAGVTLGCNPPANDQFCPGDLVTRAQMAAFLHRALQ